MAVQQATLGQEAVLPTSSPAGIARGGAAEAVADDRPR